MDKVIKLLPFKFIHVLDLNKNVTVIEIGPKTYTCLSDKKIVFGPENMVIIPPNCYCVIENPVVRNENGEVMIDKHGQAVLRYTELEIRLPGDPFPLYPGETIKKIFLLYNFFHSTKLFIYEQREMLSLTTLNNFLILFILLLLIAKRKNCLNPMILIIIIIITMMLTL